MKFKITKPQKGENFLRIQIGGNLSVSNLTHLTEKLILLEQEFSEFEISVNEVTDFDLATIQVFIAFKKLCVSDKKEAKFKFDLSKDTAELIENTGFTKVIRKL